jgi:hypothetical protein
MSRRARRHHRRRGSSSTRTREHTRRAPVRALEFHLRVRKVECEVNRLTNTPKATSTRRKEAEAQLQRLDAIHTERRDATHGAQRYPAGGWLLGLHVVHPRVRPLLDPSVIDACTACSGDARRTHASSTYTQRRCGATSLDALRITNYSLKSTSRTPHIDLAQLQCDVKFQSRSSSPIGS